MKGRLLPLGWWHYLRRGKIMDRVRVGFLGVKPEFQHTGVAAAMYVEHFDMATVTPQTWGEMGWILETNTNMNRAMEAMGGRIVRRFRIYERDLAFLLGRPNGYRSTMRRSEYLKASPPMFQSRLLDRFTRVHPVVPVLIYAPVIAALARARRDARRLVGHARARLRRLLRVDAVRVLAAPRRVPLRARGGVRREAALDDPRGPPRPPERPAAARDAAGRQHPARGRRGRRDLPRGGVGPCAGRRGRLPGRLPDLRRDPLRAAPPHAVVAAREAAARAPHAPPLPGRRQGLRDQRALLGRGLPDLPRSAARRRAAAHPSG